MSDVMKKNINITLRLFQVGITTNEQNQCVYLKQS